MSESRKENAAGGTCLLHKRVLIAASPALTEKLGPMLAAWGATVIPFQATEILKISDADTLDRVLARPEEFSWILFTSSYGVRYFLEHLRSRNLSRGDFSSARICAVGPATASSLEENDWSTDLIPQEFLAEGVLQALAQQNGGMEALRGKKVLLPRAQEARDIIKEALTAAGAQAEVLPCYKTVQAPPDPGIIREILENPADLMVFTSGSSVAGFMSQIGEDAGRLLLQKAVIAALGPIVAEVLRTHGKEPEIMPAKSTVPDLIHAIRRLFAGR
jgi:uroporphyrinogen III methyltransferase / synthase